MIDRRYYTKDAFGREVFDRRAFDDDEQMRILSQMHQERKKHKLASSGFKRCLERLFGRQKTL